MLDIVLGGRRLVDHRARQASAPVFPVGDHEVKARPDLDEEVRRIRVRLGRWRTLVVHVTKILVPAPIGDQNDTIERVQDLDVPACVPRRGW